MTDIVARIGAHLQNDNAAERHWNCDNLLEEAQAEIEKLRKFLDDVSEAYDRSLSERDDFWKARDDAWDENQKLQTRIAELDGFIKTIEEQATALEEENARLNKEVGRAMVLFNNVTAEMADAREEIREMNGRIDNLHWRGRLWPTAKI